MSPFFALPGRHIFHGRAAGRMIRPWRDNGFRYGVIQHSEGIHYCDYGFDSGAEWWEGQPGIVGTISIKVPSSQWVSACSDKMMQHSRHAFFQKWPKRGIKTPALHRISCCALFRSLKMLQTDQRSDSDQLYQAQPGMGAMLKPSGVSTQLLHGVWPRRCDALGRHNRQSESSQAAEKMIILTAADILKFSLFMLELYFYNPQTVVVQRVKHMININVSCRSLVVIIEKFQRFCS